MSIAVCAVIVPSRRLRWLLAAFCAVLCAAAFAVGLLLPGRFAFGAAVACAPLSGALLLAHACMFLRTAATVRRIDISGLGQLRVTVQQDMAGNGVAAMLLPGATVWPCCILLRLRLETGAVLKLVLLPDALGAGQYRALAVAIRAIAGGIQAGPGTAGTVEHKIL